MLLWIAILLFFAPLVLIQKIKFELSYWREGKKDLLTVALLGPFSLRLYRAEKSLAGGSPVREKLSSLKRLAPLVKWQRPLFRSVIERGHLEKLEWKTEFGTPDAALTGMVIGLAWVFHGWLLALLQNKGWETEPEAIEFVPVFDKTYFCTSFHCIVSMRIVHVISTQLRWLRLKLRQRKR